MVPQNCFGIYLIRNTINGKVYVGSTGVSFRERWDAHIGSLRLGKHQNRYLQNAWNKHGESAFEFVVFEILDDRADLIPREQFWLDTFRNHSTAECYNLSPSAGSNRGYKQSPEAIERSRIKRIGRVISEETRRKFSEIGKKRGAPLHATARSIEVNKGKPRSQETRNKISRGHLGIKHKPHVIDKFAKTYDGFVSPEGVIYRNIRNLKRFSAEHALNYSDMVALNKGHIRISKGWTRLDTDRGLFVVFSFRSPDGLDYYNITNLAEFCRAHGLGLSAMRHVWHGRMKQHKGWTKI